MIHSPHTLTDCHTHRIAGNGIVSLSPEEVAPTVALHPSILLSAGIHPWDTRGLTTDDITVKLNELAAVASLPQVIAIGEAGLDTLRGGDENIQSEALRGQILISEQEGKPLILHVVRSGHRIMALCKEMERELKPAGLRQAWIWHGFRGGADEATRFLALRKENYISIGPRFNSAAVTSLPLDRLLIETDDSRLTIEEVAATVAEALSLSPERLAAVASENLDRILKGAV